MHSDIKKLINKLLHICSIYETFLLHFKKDTNMYIFQY